jgi:hypothetical protein
MRNTGAVFMNKLAEFKKDKESLIAFALLPALAIFQVMFMGLDYGISPNDVIKPLALVAATSIFIMVLPQVIAEHRENGSLRFLVMAGIKPISYLLGVGGAFVAMGALAMTIFIWLGEFSAQALPRFISITLLAMICSMLISAILGILSKNRQKAMGLAIPVSMASMFLPQIAQTVEPLNRIFDYTFIGRGAYMMSDLYYNFSMMSILILLANIVLLSITFVVIYHKKGMKN